MPSDLYKYRYHGDMYPNVCQKELYIIKHFQRNSKGIVTHEKYTMTMNTDCNNVLKIDPDNIGFYFYKILHSHYITFKNVHWHSCDGIKWLASFHIWDLHMF